jgi:hypothetical protein
MKLPPFLKTAPGRLPTSLSSEHLCRKHVRRPAREVYSVRTSHTTQGTSGGEEAASRTHWIVETVAAARELLLRLVRLPESGIVRRPEASTRRRMRHRTVPCRRRSHEFDTLRHPHEFGDRVIVTYWREHKLFFGDWVEFGCAEEEFEERCWPRVLVVLIDVLPPLDNPAKTDKLLWTRKGQHLPPTQRS